MEQQHLTNEIARKDILTLSETMAYTGFSRRYLLKLTSTRKIPYFKPTGKTIFFRREELECWLQRNRIAPSYELEQAAQEYCNKMKGGRKQ